jgi:hypothetical protein
MSDHAPHSVENGLVRFALRPVLSPSARNLVVTRSKTRALEVMEEVREYVEGRLKLLVNQDKSKVAPLGECAFLGFTVKNGRICLSDKAAKRFKSRIQEITGRSRGISMRQRLLELKRYCVGWFHYCLTHFVRRMSSQSSLEQNRLAV